MQRFLWFCVIVATIGGFLFGYQTAVIAGAMLFVKQQFQLSIESQGMIVSIILLGALGGSLAAGVLADRFGRRSVFFAAAIACIIGTWIAATASSELYLIAGRFIAGIGVGLYSVVAPLYLGEISPLRQRGMIVSLNQLAITIGVLAAYGTNLWFAEEGAWRSMLGWGAAPAILQLICLPFMAESPQWLSRKESSEKGNKEGKSLFAPGVRLALFLGLGLSCFQQLTGINAVIYYAPQIFEMVGFTSATVALFATLGIGVINVLTTLIAVWLLDRLGRKALLLIGLAGMAIALACISTGFMLQFITIGGIAPIALMTYVAFFAMSLGPVTWVIISEIYPISIRGRAMGLATLANWLCNYLVAFLFLDLVQALGTGGAFALFTCIALLALIFVYKAIPETKGKSFEEIQRLFE